MTIVLICIIILLVVMLGIMTGLNFTNVERCEGQYKNSQFWHKKYMESEENYKALEKGRDEESDSYEQQYLTFMETIEAQANAISSYIDDLGFLTVFSVSCIQNCKQDASISPADVERVKEIREHLIIQEG